MHPSPLRTPIAFIVKYMNEYAASKSPYKLTNDLTSSGYIWQICKYCAKHLFSNNCSMQTEYAEIITSVLFWIAFQSGGCVLDAITL